MDTRKTFNTHQLNAAAEFSIPKDKFLDKDWFNSLYHRTALGYLITHKKLSYGRALLELDNLDSHQARAIMNGFLRDEVAGLDENQINAITKYHFKSEDVKGLNRYQLHCLIKLSSINKNIHISNLANIMRKYFQLTGFDHIEAAAFLFRNGIVHIAADILKDIATLTSLQAKAVCYGLNMVGKDKDSKLLTLLEYQLNVLIDIQVYKGFKSIEDIRGLNQIQLEVVKEFFYWGATCSEIKECAWLTSDIHLRALQYLMKFSFYPFKSAIQEIEGLNEVQLKCMIKFELTKKEILMLSNLFQAKALQKLSTVKNGLCAASFQGNDWFNSHEHVVALEKLLMSKYLTVPEAMAEIKQATHEHRLMSLVYSPEQKEGFLASLSAGLSAVSLPKVNVTEEQKEDFLNFIASELEAHSELAPKKRGVN